jgi:hypothetical protein
LFDYQEEQRLPLSLWFEKGLDCSGKDFPLVAYSRCVTAESLFRLLYGYEEVTAKQSEHTRSLHRSNEQ